MSARKLLARLGPAAVFGAFDGLISLVGILLPLWGSGAAAPLLHTAFGLALAEAFGMAAGAWLSADPDEGPLDAATIGLSTGLGTLLPVLPFAVLPVSAARPGCVVIIALLAGLISLVRARERGLRRALAETGLVLALALLAVYGGNWISGS